MSQFLSKSPIHDSHLALGGRLVGFAGFELPVRYGEVRTEHEAVREAAGLFDVSHMGEIFVEGTESLDYLQYITCNDVSRLDDGQAQYSAFLNEIGGVIDDLIVYRLKEDRYLLCVNAANVAKDFVWCTDKSERFDVHVSNQSESYGQIALQGPKSVDVLHQLKHLPKEASELEYFQVREFESPYGQIIVARTGYTGEDGFEIFVPREDTLRLWNDLLESGKPVGLVPCGLGARDSLRLEACYPLHGHELSEEIPALESGIGWIINTAKGDFIGCKAVLELKKAGVKNKLVGFHVKGKGIVREETELVGPEGESAGKVTSGTLTPTVGKSLGLALVPVNLSEVGTQLIANVRGRKIPIEIVKIPFYKKKV